MGIDPQYKIFSGAELFLLREESFPLFWEQYRNINKYIEMNAILKLSMKSVSCETKIFSFKTSTFVITKKQVFVHMDGCCVCCKFCVEMLSDKTIFDTFYQNKVGN